jgi:hypothetical protein
MIAALLLLAATIGNETPTPSCDGLEGFRQKGALREFNTETLFEYMNGNSEGYFAYGFTAMRGVTCTNGTVDLVFDISRMESPDLAWGMFTANRDPKLPLWARSVSGQITPRRATFAKGAHYVEVAANPAGDHSALLDGFFAVWEQKIPGSSGVPELVSAFPKDGLTVDSVRLVPESLLGFRMLRRGFLASYTNGKAFILPEASPEAAAALLEKFRARLAQTTAAPQGFEAQDKYLGRLCVFQKGRYLVGAANFPADVDPRPLASALLERLP